MKPIHCGHCGNADIKYSVTAVRIKMPKVAGGGYHTKYKHFYSCKCGASMKGDDQFDALKKWNTRIDICQNSKNIDTTLKETKYGNVCKKS